MRYPTDGVCVVTMDNVIKYKNHLHAHEFINVASAMFYNEYVSRTHKHAVRMPIDLIGGMLPIKMIYDGVVVPGFNSGTLIVSQDDRRITSCVGMLYPSSTYSDISDMLSVVAQSFTLTSSVVRESETDHDVLSLIDPLINFRSEFKHFVSTYFLRYFYDTNTLKEEEFDDAIETTWRKIHDLFVIKIATLDTRDASYNAESPICVVSYRNNNIPIFTGINSSSMRDYIAEYPEYMDICPTYQQHKWYQHLLSPLTPLIITNLLSTSLYTLYKDCKQHIVHASLSRDDVVTLNKEDITEW